MTEPVRAGGLPSNTGHGRLGRRSQSTNSALEAEGNHPQLWHNSLIDIAINPSGSSSLRWRLWDYVQTPPEPSEQVLCSYEKLILGPIPVLRG